MTHEEIVKQKVAVISYLRDYGLDDGDTMTAEEIAELCESIVEHFCTTYRAQVLEEERKFILNVLDGIDLADEQMGNKGGGTKAIRFALQSRIIHPTN